VKDEIKRILKKAGVSQFKVLPGIHLGLRKTAKNLSQDSRSPVRDFNLGPPEYKAGVLTTRPLHSVDSITRDSR
jgi:hypothetical protein